MPSTLYVNPLAKYFVSFRAMLRSVALAWRSWLHSLPAASVTLDLRWSHVAVSDDMDPLSAAGHHHPQGVPAAARGGGGSGNSGRERCDGVCQRLHCAVY